MELDYSRIDALSDPTHKTLVQLCVTGERGEWRLIGRTDGFWLLTVLVGEREACYIGVARPVEGGETDCPLEQIAEEAGLHIAVRSDDQNGYHRRHAVISSDSDSASTVTSMWETDDASEEKVDHSTLGDVLGYPSAAVDAFSETTEADVLQFVETEMDISQQEARYLYSCPYLPAPEEASIRTAIARGKRYASIPSRIIEDRDDFAELPADRCPLPIPADQWSNYVNHVMDTQ